MPLFIKTSVIGEGISRRAVTAEPVKKGAIVYTDGIIDDSSMDKEQLLYNFIQKRNFDYENLGDARFIYGCSKNPTLEWIPRKHDLVAVRDLEIGEELTFLMLTGEVIDNFTKSLVNLLNKLEIKTVNYCDGFPDEYPWIDIEINYFTKIVGLIGNYDKKSEILMQVRDNPILGPEDMCLVFRILPFCKDLDEGRQKFKDFEQYVDSFIKRKHGSSN